MTRSLSASSLQRLSCGAGTQFLLYHGGTVDVQDMDESSILMGDDSTPRSVQAGSFAAGRTEMFRIVSKSDGRQLWTCSADHKLILRLAAPPWVTPGKNNKDWSVAQYSLRYGSSKESQIPFVKTVQDKFPTQQAAAIARNQIIWNSWKPLEFECSVSDYLAINNQEIYSLLTMHQPETVTWQPDGESLEMRLKALMKTDQVMMGTLLNVAWALGVWFAHGSKSLPRINVVKRNSDGGDSPKNKTDHQTMIQQLRMVAISLGTDSSRILLKQSLVTNRGEPISRLNMGSVFEGLLTSYGLIRQKTFPKSILSESTSVRRALVAGILDGYSEFDSTTNSYSIRSQKLMFMLSLVPVLRSIGLVTSQIHREKSVIPSGVEIQEAFKINITGEDLAMLNPFIRRTLRQYPDMKVPPHGIMAATPDARAIGFTVEPAGEDYCYTFKLDGNGRCLMGDYVVAT